MTPVPKTHVLTLRTAAPEVWTVDQVAGYLPMVGMSDWVEQFRYNEISGQALLDLASASAGYGLPRADRGACTRVRTPTT